MPKCVLGHMGTVISPASMQSHQNIHCPLTESLDTMEFMNSEQRHTLRKHAYSNILKIAHKIADKKNFDIFHILAQNIDCGYMLEPPRRGGSNEYPQSMLLSRNKKKNIYPCKP